MAKSKQKTDAIEACKDKSGRIRLEAVVEAARDIKSVLHNEFEWDVKKGHHRANSGE